MRNLRLFPKAATGTMPVALDPPRKLAVNFQVLMQVKVLAINSDQLIASGER